MNGLKRDNTMKTILFNICLLIIPILAENQLRIETGSVSVPDTGKFYIVLENETRINGLNLIVEYDPVYIRPISILPIDRGLALTSTEGQTFSGNKMSFIMFDLQGTFLLPDSGRIFEIDFLVSDTSIVEDTTTQVIFSQGSVADSSLNLIEFNYYDGVIPIIAPVGIDPEPEAVYPKKFVLGQNYPNPFNPTTTIPFALPTASKVTLKIFNVLGQEVAVILKNNRFEAGWHKFNFETSNYASGIYFYRIIAEPYDKSYKTFNKVLKLVHVK